MISSSALSRPPVRLEMVPPVATSLTRGPGVLGAAVAAAGAWADCAAGAPADACGGAGAGRGIGAALAAQDRVAIRDIEMKPADADRMAAECT